MPSLTFSAKSNNVHKLQEFAEFALRDLVGDAERAGMTVVSSSATPKGDIEAYDSYIMYSASVGAEVSVISVYAQDFVLSWKYGN